VLTATLLFVLAAVAVSVGLVVYTAWLHDLKDGLFALLFAILSVRAALSWVLWQRSEQPVSRQDREGQKPAGEATR
jgi:membrane protein implicated in regulation of membrane protease activity